MYGRHQRVCKWESPKNSFTILSMQHYLQTLMLRGTTSAVDVRCASGTPINIVDVSDHRVNATALTPFDIERSQQYMRREAV